MKTNFLRSLLSVAALATFVFVLALSCTNAAEVNFTPIVRAPSDTMTSFVYFTGIGCPHCANVDPVLLKQRIRKGNLLIVEYEIYQDSVNAPLLIAYNSQFDTGLGVPMIMTEGKKGGAIVGDTSILENLDSLIAQHKGKGVALPGGNKSFAELLLTDLPKKPKIWFKDRVAIRKDMASKESNSIKKFLLEGVLPQGSTPVQEKDVALSDDKVIFREAYDFGGWILMRD